VETSKGRGFSARRAKMGHLKSSNGLTLGQRGLEWRHGADSEETMALEEALVTVWWGALVEGAEEVELEGQRFAVRETPRKRLREVDLCSRGRSCAGWSRIRKRNRAGRNWRERGTR